MPKVGRSLLGCAVVQGVLVQAYLYGDTWDVQRDGTELRGGENDRKAENFMRQGSGRMY